MINLTATGKRLRNLTVSPSIYFPGSVWMVLNSRIAVRSFHYYFFFFCFRWRKISGFVVTSAVRDCFSEYFDSSLGHWPQVWKLQDISSCSLFFGTLVFHNSSFYPQAFYSGTKDLPFHLRGFWKSVNLYHSIKHYCVRLLWKPPSSYFSSFLF